MNREKFRRTYRYRNGKRSEKGREDYHVGRYRRAIAGGETGTFHVSYMKFAHKIRTRGSFFFSPPFISYLLLSLYQDTREGPVRADSNLEIKHGCMRIGGADRSRRIRTNYGARGRINLCAICHAVFNVPHSHPRNAEFSEPPRIPKLEISGIESTVMKVSGVVTYANKSMGNVNLFISHYSRRRDEIHKRDYVREKKRSPLRKMFSLKLTKI